MGFYHCKSFIILEHDVDSPFKWYQSIDDPSLAFIIVDTYLFKPDYRIQISSQEIAPLQALEVEALVPVAIVSIHPELPRPITVNLQGPILINPDNRWARQCVLLRGGGIKLATTCKGNGTGPWGAVRAGGVGQDPENPEAVGGLGRPEQGRAGEG